MSLLSTLRKSLAPNIVIGIGTGRCGTTSLAKLLIHQRGCYVTHERTPLVPWEFDLQFIRRRLRMFYLRIDKRWVGDVSSAYLPYSHFIISSVPNAKIVCLKRDQHETVASFMSWTSPHSNPWVAHNGIEWDYTPYDVMFPKYQFADKGLAITKYWEDYYCKAASLEARYPNNFRIFDIDHLNRSEGIARILNFVGIEPPYTNVATRFHENSASSLRAADEAGYQ